MRDCEGGATIIYESGSLFGFKNENEHEDFATAKVNNTTVLEIPTFIFGEIIKQTALEISAKKIDFLVRFGPAFRSCDLGLITNCEQLFKKEEATLGFNF